MIKNRLDPPPDDVEIDIATNNYVAVYGYSEFNSRFLEEYKKRVTNHPFYK